MYEPILKEIIEICLKTINQPKNKKKFEMYLVHPLVNVIWEYIKPYIILMTLSGMSILFFLIAILLLITNKKV